LDNRDEDCDDEECTQIIPETKKTSGTTTEFFLRFAKKAISIKAKGSSSQEDYRKSSNLSERSTSSLIYEVEPAHDFSAKANLRSIASIDEGANSIPSDIDECEDGNFRTRDAQVFELDDWNQEELLDDLLTVKKQPNDSSIEKIVSLMPQKSHHQPQQFRLLYIPSTFTRKHIVAKLETFGPLNSFEFVNLPDPNTKKANKMKQQFVSNPKLASFKGYLSQQPQGKVEEFKGAIFTFANESAELKFSEIKRLRVKGLQIKVLIHSTQKEKPAKPPAQPRNPKKDIPTSLAWCGAQSPIQKQTWTHPENPLPVCPRTSSTPPEDCCSSGLKTLQHNHRPTSKHYRAEPERQRRLADHMSTAANYTHHRQANRPPIV
jgi:hypothetical protein